MAKFDPAFFGVLAHSSFAQTVFVLMFLVLVAHTARWWFWMLPPFIQVKRTTRDYEARQVAVSYSGTIRNFPHESSDASSVLKFWLACFWKAELDSQLGKIASGCEITLALQIIALFLLMVFGRDTVGVAVVLVKFPIVQGISAIVFYIWVRGISGQWRTVLGWLRADA